MAARHPKESRAANQLRRVNSMKGKHMRRITIVLACAMMAPLAFGQPVANTSVVEHTGQFVHAPTQITTGAVRIGTVTAFNPGRRNVEPPSPIVVQSSPDTKPVSYLLWKSCRIIYKCGIAF